MKSGEESKFKFDWLATVALLAHLPMGVEYSLRMWRTGHYQFFPFLFAVVGWLFYERVSGLKSNCHRPMVSYFLLGLNVLLLVAAVLFYSSTIWMLSFLLLLIVLIHDRFGLKGCLVSAPAWLLLLFVFPLPGGIDLVLINKLQFLASQLASWVLDSARLLHFREGVVLITEKKQFFAEEACSGVRSLFSSIAAISVFGVYVRYPWWRLVFNLVQTTFWVIVGNALRIAAVVYISDNWTDSIATGPAHELLGFGSFLLIFALSMSTDQALNLFSTTTSEAIGDLPVSPLDQLPPEESQTNTKRSGQLGIAIAIVFIAVTLFSGRLTYAKLSKDHLRQQTFSGNQLTVLEIDDLPAEINGWRRVGFEHKVRNEHSLLAPESFLWTYEKAATEVTISLDSPYYRFHNLNTCYDGLGWVTSCTHDYGTERELPGDRSMLTMQKKNLRGIVLFTAFDRRGNLVLPDESFFVGGRWRSVIENIHLALGTTASAKESRLSDGSLPISQIQLFANSEDADQQVDDLENLFVLTREKLLKSPRFANQDANSP